MLRRLLLLLVIIFPSWTVADDSMQNITPEQLQEQAEKLAQPKLTTQQNVTQLYRWFNAIGNPDNPLTLDDVQDYFTPNAFMLTNGEIVASGYKGLFQHFELLRTYYKSEQVSLPFLDTVISGDKVAIRYVINATTSNDQQFKIYVVAILRFVNDKVSEFSEVVYKEPVKINAPKQPTIKK